jgi:hypothetical protein
LELLRLVFIWQGAGIQFLSGLRAAASYWHSICFSSGNFARHGFCRSDTKPVTRREAHRLLAAYLLLDSQLRLAETDVQTTAMSMCFAPGTAGGVMAKYGKAAARTVKSAMHRKKKGTLKSGSGRKVKSRKQAIAIGLSEARKKGAKVPRRKT